MKNCSQSMVNRLGFYIGNFLILGAWPFSTLTGGGTSAIIPVFAGIAFLLVYSIYSVGVALKKVDQDPTVDLLIAVWSLFLISLTLIFLSK